MQAYSGAGGVVDFAVESDAPEDIKRFRALWRLILARYAPGVGFSDAIGDGRDESTARMAAWRGAISFIECILSAWRGYE